MVYIYFSNFSLNYPMHFSFEGPFSCGIGLFSEERGEGIQMDFLCVWNMLALPERGNQTVHYTGTGGNIGPGI